MFENISRSFDFGAFQVLFRQSHIQSQFITEYSYRVHISVVLKKIIEENEQNNNNNYIVTLPPSGLRDCYLRILNKMDCVVIALHDQPENIFKRITFYDGDCR